MNFETDGTREGTILYQYTPSSGAAAAFMGMFGAATLAHLGMLVYFRAPYFLPLVVGGIMEVAGFYGRSWGSSEPHNFGAFVLQSFMLVLAPIFIAATVYMSFARVVIALGGQKFSSISTRWLSKLFILGDIACFFVQLAGLGMQATTSVSTQHTGRVVVLVGLVLQLLLTVLFIAVCWSFYVKYSNSVEQAPLDGNWKRYTRTLSGCGILLIVRNVFRCAEYGEGPTGSVNAHEAYTYALDAVPMLLLVTCLIIFYPGVLTRKAKRRAAGKAEA